MVVEGGGIAEVGGGMTGKGGSAAFAVVMA